MWGVKYIVNIKKSNIKTNDSPIIVEREYTYDGKTRKVKFEHTNEKTFEVFFKELITINK
jgi:hypothetical protein